MEKLIIPAVSLLLALGGAAAAQTATVIVPGEVRSYVLAQKTPSAAFEGELAVGTTLPETVEIHTIPDQPDFGYVIVNDKRVLVKSEDPHGG